MSTNFTDEQLMAYKRAGFSPEEVSLFAHNPKYAPSQEELEALMETNDVAKTLNTLPKDLDKFFEDINKTYGVLFKSNIPQKQFQEAVEALAKQNPELAKQVASFALLLDYAEETETSQETEN